MKLFVVESPNKVRKIRGILDAYEPGQWSVVATVGHWRTLPPMEGQRFEDVADPADGFREKHVVAEDKRDVEKRLREAIAKATVVYLATDDDREGEAIAWHLEQHFGLRGAKRVRCREITKAGILSALTSSGEVDYGRVDAQRCRALLDYLIGLNASRMLWRFGAKSAGRLQSCALRVVVEREESIRRFVPEPFWTVRVAYDAGDGDGNGGFEGVVGDFQRPSQQELDSDERLAVEDEPRLVPRRFEHEADAQQFARLARERPHRIQSLDVTRGQRHPPPPLTTAELLGHSSVRLGWGADKTTKLAQALFEKGAVTYIRTDSTVISDDAVREIRQYIGARFPLALPDEPVRHGAKAGEPQGAHEAIRPTRMTVDPTRGSFDSSSSLSDDEQALYDLIFTRTLCSQAKAAQLDKTTARIDVEGAGFCVLAHGSVLVEPGWLRIEQPADDGPGAQEGHEPATLPPLREGQELVVAQVRVDVTKTRAPPRFTERSLIKHLERRGVGRPSTYASVLAKLQQRDYVVVAKGKMAPGETGWVANELMTLGFDELSAEGFTAATEHALDAVADGRVERRVFLEKFYAKFRRLEEAATRSFEQYGHENPEQDRQRLVEHDRPCPKCSAVMHVRTSKAGEKFAKCSATPCGEMLDLEPPAYHGSPCPTCGARVLIKSYTRDGAKKKLHVCSRQACSWKSSFAPPRVGKRPCPKCGGKMLQRRGVDGSFWSCARYPACKGALAATKRRRSKAGLAG